MGLAGVACLAIIIAKGDAEIEATGEGIDGFFWVAYIMLALILFFVVMFVLKKLLSGNIKKTLISIATFIVIILIAYLLADGVETPLREGGMLSANGSKWVGTGLYTFYILAIVAIFSMIFSGFKKITTR